MRKKVCGYVDRHLRIPVFNNLWLVSRTGSRVISQLPHKRRTHHARNTYHRPYLGNKLIYSFHRVKAFGRNKGRVELVEAVYFTYERPTIGLDIKI